MTGLLRNTLAQDSAAGGGALLFAALAAPSWTDPATITAALGALLLVVRSITELVRILKGSKPTDAKP